MNSGYGLIETITGAMSIHSIKKTLTSTFTDESGRTRTSYGTLKDHFTQKFGKGRAVSYAVAQLNFIRSLAAYSIATYVLNLKDRHNGNILIDEEGHLVRKFPKFYYNHRHRLWLFLIEFTRTWHGI